jgi:single-strand selective monofunctional uracil DNA glycosylase
MISAAMALVDIAEELRDRVATLSFSAPVSHVYNPLEYAWDAHQSYLSRYGDSPKEILLVGMNPGPWGMAQTGVPFGEVAISRDWLGIETAVGRPVREHPRRPVEGFACARSEVSGHRLWGWARDCFGTPERFFSRFWVYNYCPLMFLEESGRNRTPDRLPAAERRPLEAHCDRALRHTVEELEVTGLATLWQAPSRRSARSSIRVQPARPPTVAGPRPSPVSSASSESMSPNPFHAFPFQSG